jgi:4'-phosphopantetheinyl transferase
MNVIYYLDISAHTWDQLKNNLAILPACEKKKILSMRKETDRCLMLSGKILLLHILKEYEYWEKDMLPEFLFNNYGKPYIQNMKGYFNISHSGNIAVCGYSNGILGVDIEKIQPCNLEDFELVLTNEEYSSLASGTLNDFYRLWTQKEAIIKAIGKGFYMNPVEIDLSKNIRKTYFEILKDKKIWYIYNCDDICGYSLTIASQYPDIPVIKKLVCKF